MAARPHRILMRGRRPPPLRNLRIYCHGCKNFSWTSQPAAGEEPTCPRCNSDFVERVEETQESTDAPAAVSPSQLGAQEPIVDADPRSNATLQGLLDQIAATIGRGDSVVHVTFQTGGPQPAGLASAGDYFAGPLNSLIQQLMARDENRRFGTPPAAPAAVDELPTEVFDATAPGEHAECHVCLETFKTGESVRTMPCRHRFHADCINPWLQEHCSCPTCRHELPSADPDYETAKARRAHQEPGDGAGSGAG